MSLGTRSRTPSHAPPRTLQALSGRLVPVVHEDCGGVGDFQQRIEADLHRDGYPDAGGRILDAGAVRQEGFLLAQREEEALEVLLNHFLNPNSTSQTQTHSRLYSALKGAGTFYFTRVGHFIHGLLPSGHAQSSVETKCQRPDPAQRIGKVCRRSNA